MIRLLSVECVLLDRTTIAAWLIASIDCEQPPYCLHYFPCNTFAISEMLSRMPKTCWKCSEYVLASYEMQDIKVCVFNVLPDKTGEYGQRGRLSCPSSSHYTAWYVCCCYEQLWNTIDWNILQVMISWNMDDILAVCHPRLHSFCLPYQLHSSIGIFMTITIDEVVYMLVVQLRDVKQGGLLGPADVLGCVFNECVGQDVEAAQQATARDEDAWSDTHKAITPSWWHTALISTLYDLYQGESPFPSTVIMTCPAN